MAQSTSDYYKNNPEAKKKRQKQQAAYNQTPKGKALKRNANRLNRKLGTYGNGDGKDAAHYKGSTTNGRLQSPAVNRKSRLKVSKK